MVLLSMKSKVLFYQAYQIKLECVVYHDIEKGTELMQVDGQQSLQVVNMGDGVLRLFVTISPMGTDAFATDADI